LLASELLEKSLELARELARELAMGRQKVLLKVCRML
jgi:hypothetical protein